jgi:predicted ATP-dependent endonuclease of OLD family
MVINSITLKNFKAIGNISLELRELKKINFIVGENGAGKSSFFEALLTLNNNYYSNILKELYGGNMNLKFYNTENKVINPDKYKIYYITFQHPNFSEIFLEKLSELLLQSMQIPDNRNNNFSDSKYNISSHNYKIREKGILIDNNIFNLSFPFANQYGGRHTNIYLNHNSVSKLDLKFYPSFIDKYGTLSDGERQLIEALTSFYKIFEDIHNNTENIILLIEEPESRLHPNLQKKFLEFFLNSFECFKKSNSLEIELPLTFISTHSSFILNIPEKYNDNYKIYLLKDGKTVDLFDKANKISKYGYSTLERQLKNVVNKLLGVKNQDFGIAENYILVEETSKKIFIEKVILQQWFKFDIAVICAYPSGDNGLIQFNEKISNLMSINQLVSSNILFSNKYIIFTDYVDEYYNDKNEVYLKKSKNNNGNNTHKKAFNLKKSLEKRFVTTLSEEIESDYPLDLVNNYLQNKHNLHWDGEKRFKCLLEENHIQNAGKIKCELASFVGENISKEEFVEKFKQLSIAIGLE